MFVNVETETRRHRGRRIRVSGGHALRKGATRSTSHTHRPSASG
jgi:hypothetical protein